MQEYIGNKVNRCVKLNVFARGPVCTHCRLICNRSSRKLGYSSDNHDDE